VKEKKRLKPEEATRKIREIVRHGGTVILSRHCRTRMLERNLTIHDLLSVLSNGNVTGPPEYSEEHHQYRYKVAGQTIDGEEAIAITVIVSHRSALIITMY